MDFTFTEEQQAAVEAARAVLSGVSPDAVPSPTLSSSPVADDFDRGLWRKLAEADLLGLVLDAEYGGAGLDTVALCLLLREAGRVLARVPLLETCAAALALQRHGDGELRSALLPKVVTGDLVLTVAANGRTGHDPAELAVTARHENGSWTLDGVQTVVPWAKHADLILVPAQEAMFHVKPDTDGVTLLPQVSTNGEEYAELNLDGARADRVITAPGAWDRLRGLLTVGTSAFALGLGEQVLRMTAEYTGKREQFGHPLATFQAVAMQAADRYIDLRAMEVALWQAAWRLDNEDQGTLPVAADVAVAKIWASEGVRNVAQTAQHLHGGFGADTDYALHRYHAWAKHVELALGSAAVHEDALGDLLAAHSLG